MKPQHAVAHHNGFIRGHNDARLFGSMSRAKATRLAADDVRLLCLDRTASRHYRDGYMIGVGSALKPKARKPLSRPTPPTGIVIEFQLRNAA